MLKKISNPFQSCESEYNEARVVIFSCPMDTTCSFRPGTRFAGPAIRTDSFGVEWYSPYMDMDLKDYNTCDTGDLDLPIGDVKQCLEIIENATTEILNDNKLPMMIGGEHLVSLGVFRAMGGRTSELSRIFTLQVVTIGTIICVLSAISLYFITPVIDSVVSLAMINFLGEVKELTVSIVVFKPLILLIDIAVVMLITVISSIVLLIKLHRIKPINIMRHKD